MPDFSTLVSNFAADPHPILLAIGLQGAAIGLIVLGIGVVLRAISNGFGLSVVTIGTRIIAHCIALLLLQFVFIQAFGSSIHPAILAIITILLVLFAVHWLINLLFGSEVGNRVIADLLSSLLHGLGFVLSKPFKMLKETFRHF
ncbi:hypothetical protein [uncultured Aliiroseovarius sp.]|uniref:hypothetical protein n=1 Tax=uncultured Aliiroseovarius sp. TaxID=1658783 RepID=UPI002631D029|nr:hypothetical protein [uncultured Aliiroseovarius sp.]